MTNREVHVIIPMKASEAERVRELLKQADQYPAFVLEIAARVQQLLLGEATEGDGEELARLLRGLSQDAARAKAIWRVLRDVLARAVISDPIGSKEALQ